MRMTPPPPHCFSVSIENTQILPQGGSRETSHPSLQSGAADDDGEDDFDETSLFLEIDRELAHLLSGLGGGGGQDEPAENAVPTTMIPCNGQSGALPDPQTSKPEKSIDSLLESGLVLAPWAEAPVSPSSAAPAELSAHAPGVNGEARNVLSGRDAPPDVPAPAVLAYGPGASAFGSHAEGLLDQPLEESSKILAEIPGIFTAFLDGGQAKEKSHKKIRFAESRPENAQDLGRAGLDPPGTDVQGEDHREVEVEVKREGGPPPGKDVQGEDHGEVEVEVEGGVKGDASLENVEALEKPPNSTNSVPSPLPQPGPVEDEVFRTVPEVCVESPESETTPELNSR